MRTMMAMVLAGALIAPASGQQMNFRDHGSSRAEGAVGIGFTVPFGGKRQSERAPRLELRLSRDTINFDGSRQSQGDDRRFESRIGIAFDGERTLLVNGRPVEPARRSNLSTGAAVAIGVVAVLVVGGLLVADAASDASE